VKQIAALCACAMVSWVPLTGQIALPPGVTPASQKSTIQIQRSAAELLSRYTKQKDGNFLFQMRGAFGERWVECNGLAISGVTPRHVTPADQANGLKAIHIVSINTRMHRAYDQKTTQWSEWRNGRHAYIPGTIRVTESHSGQLTAEPSMLSYFVAFTARGNADLIPMVRERVIQKPKQANPVPVSKPFSQPRIPFPPPASPPETEKQPVPRNPVHAATKGIVDMAMKVGVGLGVFVAMAGVLVALLQGQRVKGRAGSTPRTYPGVLPPNPPSLPAAAAPAPDLSSLIIGHTHLLTAAEQSFHAVLQTIVRPTCAISTKVRLADLFKVRQGRGQQAAFNRISRKHVDFVLIDPASTRIICAIELDDSSHNRPDRIARDQFVDELFANNQMPLVHIPFEWKYNPSAIRAKLIQAGVPLSDQSASGTPPPLPAG
jgi:hypothetical protein